MNLSTLAQRRLMWQKILSVALAAGLVTGGAPAFAQRNSVLEEVIVTAQKREQNANDVGIAITAFSGEQMEALNFSNAADVAMQSPNVEIRRHFVGRGLTTNLFIRGVGSSDLNNGSESPVAAFVDEFYLISSSTVDFSLYDMARTEVVKGPQGTLFGRNATGGAFQFVTQEPEDELKLYVEGTLGTDGIQQGETRLNIPVNDRLKLRFSATHDRRDAYTKNNYPGRADIHESDFNAYRGQIKFDVTEQWTSLLKIERGIAKGNLPGDNLNPMMKVGDDIVFADATDLGAVKDADPDSVSHNSADFASNKVQSYLWRNVWEGDELTFTSITGLMDQEYGLMEDCDATEISACNFNPFYESTHYSQELRLSGDTENFTWTVGAYYLNQNAEGGYNLNILNGIADPNVADGGILQHGNFNLDVESYAVFGQTEFFLSDSLTLITGLRAMNDTKTFTQESYQDFVTVKDFDFDDFSDFSSSNITKQANLASNIFNQATAGSLTEIDEDSVSGTLQLNWQPTDEALYYASYRRGVKAGGFNIGVVPLGLSPEQYPYEKETLDAYEVGAKLAFVGGKARVNMAAFYYDYSDYQAASFAALGQFFDNRDASITGAELELIANPYAGLDIILGTSFLDTEVKDVERAGSILDTDMGEAPSLTANLVVRYEWSIPTGFLAAQVDGNYVDERYSDVLNQTAATLPSYSLFNASLTYTHQDEGMFVRLWVKNLADKRIPLYRIELTDVLNSGQDDFNEPRTAGVTIGYHF